MSTTFTYSAVSSAVTLLDSTGSSGDAAGADLKGTGSGLANNGYAMAPAITPTATGPELFGGYAMLAQFATAPASGVTAYKCWFVDSQDGTNYDSMSATNQPTRAPDFVFFWPNVASATGPFYMQSVPRTVARPPWKHKILMQNVSGVTSASSASNLSKLLGVTVSELGT